MKLLLGILERPCDLDLLRFFHRHSRALLSADYLVRRVGYDIEEIRRSLDLLSRAGLLEWSKRESIDGDVRLYRLTVDIWGGGLLAAFLWLASSSEGQRALRKALAGGKRDLGDRVAGPPTPPPPEEADRWVDRPSCGGIRWSGVSCRSSRGRAG